MSPTEVAGALEHGATLAPGQVLGEAEGGWVFAEKLQAVALSNKLSQQISGNAYEPQRCMVPCTSLQSVKAATSLPPSESTAHFSHGQP